MPTVTQVLRRFPQVFTHPYGIGRAVRDQFIHFRRSPLDREIPWFSYCAIDFLEQYLQLRMSVYEFGSGGSTLWLAARVAKLVTIEERAEWADAVSERLDRRGLRHRVEIRLREPDRSSPTAFAASPYAQALPDEPADVIVIDGCERRSHDDLRPVAFHLAEERVRPGGLIVVDDAKRYPQLRHQNRARDIRACWGFGPCRYDRAETDIFVY